MAERVRLEGRAVNDTLDRGGRLPWLDQAELEAILGEILDLDDQIAGFVAPWGDGLRLAKPLATHRKSDGAYLDENPLILRKNQVFTRESMRETQAILRVLG